MKKEVLHAVNFLVDMLRINSAVLTEEQLLKFRKHAYECLWQHYQDHWFPESPMKGSGYRCIRINGKMDPLIARAGALVGLASGALRSLFPSELTMWIDPSEVAYRIGENGSICNLYVQLSNNPSSSSSSSSTSAPDKKLKEEPSPSKLRPRSTSPPPHPSLPFNKSSNSSSSSSSNNSSSIFSPSKSPVHYQSPPRSPLFNTSQQLSVQQQLAAMFLMNNHNPGNCKDSLRSSSLESSRGMERLFVSS